MATLVINFMKKLIIIHSLFLTLISVNANAGILDASNYDDCVLDVTHNAKTDAALNAGVSACQHKFKYNKINSYKGCMVVWNGKAFSAVDKAPLNYSSYDIRRYEEPVAMAYISNKVTEKDANQLIDKSYWQIVNECSNKSKNNN